MAESSSAMTSEDGVSQYSNRGKKAGIITKIRLQNFMCHSNLEIELGDHVNFITGLNGSGKSAILAALSVTFGSRTKLTQRANVIKDFIKTGCSYAQVHVELKNEGEDAFQPEKYGNRIILERKITSSNSSRILKNYQGKMVATGKEDLQSIIAHFNIDVENPCVMLSQDQSREFFHSGNAKDKFKFFYRATLFHKLEGLLREIDSQLDIAIEFVVEQEKSLRPLQQELEGLEAKIKSLEHVAEITQQIRVLKKKLAWSYVYSVEEKLVKQLQLIEKAKRKIVAYQEMINEQNNEVEQWRDKFSDKEKQCVSIANKIFESRKKKEDMERTLSMAVREKAKLELENDQAISHIQKIMKRRKLLEQQIHEMIEKDRRDKEVDEFKMAEELKSLESEVSEAYSICQRLKEEEDTILQDLNLMKDEISRISSQIRDVERKSSEIYSHIRHLQRQQTNKVTAFGGPLVMRLLQAIDRHRHKFRRPPIGPIGSHLTLVHDEKWAVAVENAVGKWLNAFIVTDHKDSLVLRACAREANYNYLKVIIYEFSKPRLSIPSYMLPQTDHPTALSVIHTDSPTVFNVLIDVVNAERQVLVKDYDAAKEIAFGRRLPNLKEVYTSDGYKIMQRASFMSEHGLAQYVLPPMRNARYRLCSSFGNKTKYLEEKAFETRQQAQLLHGNERCKKEAFLSLQNKLNYKKRRCQDAWQDHTIKKLKLDGLKKSIASEAEMTPLCSVDELYQEISNSHEEMHENEVSLKDLQNKLAEANAEVDNLKAVITDICNSVKGDLKAFNEEQEELEIIDRKRRTAETNKKYYESCLKEVLPYVEKAEAHYSSLEQEREVNRKKASIICPETDIDMVEGGKQPDPSKLSAQVTHLNWILERESQRNSESIDELRMLYEKKQHTISRKQQTYEAFRDKLNVLKQAMDNRNDKFQRNATLSKRQLTWKFNGLLSRKGISGRTRVSYEDQTLSIEVKLPQDVAGSIQETKGLSGGERSFSTLCFALSLHEMIESPFRAMDEFDVFMDTISRKISLDTLVDFAIAQGSQWIFITPHDISMVKADEKIKKQQLAAPRQ